MKNRDISKHSQAKVIKYMEYQHDLHEQEGNLQQGQQVLDGISKNIREEVYKEFYKPILRQSLKLTTYFPSQFLEHLSLCMKEVNFTVGENIWQQGEINQCLYYVNKG